MYFGTELSERQKLRIRLCEAQNWRCCYCKLPVEFYFRSTRKQNAATIEHVFSRAKGGKDNNSNRVIACSQCNNLRNVYHPFLFEQTVLWLFETPVIKTAWHKFSRKQAVTLSKIILRKLINLNKGDTANPPDLKPLLQSLHATNAQTQKRRG